MILAGLLAGGGAAVPRVFASFSRTMPENYRYLVREQLARKNFAGAEQLIQRRLSQEFYDFEARFLLAEVYAAKSNYSAAADAVAEAIQKTAAVKGRDVRASGYDDATAYLLLGRYLWAAGQFTSGGDMLRVALDCGASRKDVETIGSATTSNTESLVAMVRLASKLKNQVAVEGAVRQLRSSAQANARIAASVLEAGMTLARRTETSAALQLLVSGTDGQTTPPLIAATLQNLIDNEVLESTTETAQLAQHGTKTVPLQLSRFALPPGAITTTHGIMLRRNGATAARFDTGVYKTTSLLVRARGTPALGMWPILVLRSGENVLARLYLDGPQPALYDLPLWPTGTPKSLPLTLAFETDAYDPLTNDDRNIEVLDLRLH